MVDPPTPRDLPLLGTETRWIFATRDERAAEILAVRYQVLVLRRRVARPVFTEIDRTILAVLSVVFDRRRLREVFLIVQSATVIASHRASSPAT
ncbi:MAG: hypothetical protein M5T61_15130 [Acidimicrobiia bacterium]|nr:hypothetical protein [Acidimicrobiia bacterium]